MVIIPPSSAQLAFDFLGHTPICGECPASPTCPVCDNPLGSLYHSDGRRRKYCSRQCTDESRRQKRPSKPCVVCGKSFSASASVLPGLACCSRECNRIRRSNRQLGPKNHNWQGGKTAVNSALRNKPEYKAWRDSVYIRDNFTCQMCNRRGGGRRSPLNAHHIKPLARYPELALVLANGITLCESCHNSFKGNESLHEATFFAITGGVDAQQ
jgi:5-methylcytosine-specific restriction endonuclease McrA